MQLRIKLEELQSYFCRRNSGPKGQCTPNSSACPPKRRRSTFAFGNHTAALFLKPPPLRRASSGPSPRFFSSEKDANDSDRYSGLQFASQHTLLPLMPPNELRLKSVRVGDLMSVIGILEKRDSSCKHSSDTRDLPWLRVIAVELVVHAVRPHQRFDTPSKRRGTCVASSTESTTLKYLGVPGLSISCVSPDPMIEKGPDTHEDVGDSKSKEVAPQVPLCRNFARAIAKDEKCLSDLPAGFVMCNDRLSRRLLACSSFCPFRHYFKDDAEKTAAVLRRRLKSLQDAEQVDAGGPSVPAIDATTWCSRRFRGRVFAEWLVRTYDIQFLKREAAPVIDIASGSGTTARPLLQRFGIPCVTVDPRSPKEHAPRNGRQRPVIFVPPTQMGNGDFWGSVPMLPHVKESHETVKQLSGRSTMCKKSREFLSCRNVCSEEQKSCQPKTKNAGPSPLAFHLSVPFASNICDQYPGFAPLIQRASLLIGLHPDEATEAIVDAAIQFRKPFALVPCCVFPDMFPGRYLPFNLPTTSSTPPCITPSVHKSKNVAGQTVPSCRTEAHMRQKTERIFPASAQDTTSASAMGSKPVPVRSHKQLIEYLQQKCANGRIFTRKAVLPFYGRNTVLYCIPPDIG
eukprot:GHVT01064644.1.p1 GENE.GHVT01064644.1~~GHVT01064644.1.p1  ORF type:complete len:627 (+),score=25.49 GHVT01064644.1:292-2172(+)